MKEKKIRFTSELWLEEVCKRGGECWIYMGVSLAG
jgi:hypothetical protein